MFKRVLSLFFVLMLMVGGAAACGDDSGDDGGSDGGSSEDSGDSGDSGDTGDSGDGGGETGSDEVETYCQEAEELGAELQAVIDDPTSGDVAEIQAQAQELVAAATELSTSNPEEAERITECSEALQVTP